MFYEENKINNAFNCKKWHQEWRGKNHARLQWFKKRRAAYQSNTVNKEPAIQTVKELEVFHQKCTEYLKKTKIILDAKNQADKLNARAEQVKLYINNSIFNGNILEFTKNTAKL